MSAQQRSQLMSRIRSKNTGPELVLRRLLHASGYRYRLHGALPDGLLESMRKDHPEIPLRGGKLPGSPDLVFTAKRKAVFVDGCFWHGHDCPVGRRRPSSNTGYWNPKLDGNQARDQRNRRELLALGWESMTVWECELDSAEQVLHTVTRFLGPASGADQTGTGQQQ